MSKVLIVVFLIFGMVFGAGFSSGNEIVVFFSRFGVLSYLYILLAGFLLFWIFYFFLTTKISSKLNKSKFLNALIFFITLVYCASMFAGIIDLFNYFPIWFFVLLIAATFVFCVIVTKNGVGGLEKANLILMPVTGVVFLVILIYASSISSDIWLQTNSWAGFLYSPLYVALNTCMGGVVMSQAGQALSKRQAFWTSLISSVLLAGFLLLGNFVLQQNSDSFLSEMPFLSIVKGNGLMFVLTYLVILVGCWTTLISLTVTLKSSFDKMVKSDIFSTILAVLVPFLLSVIGFAQIVSLLYPLCSVLGIFVLAYFLWSGKNKKD